jgi:hypothetical protein
MTEIQTPEPDLRPQTRSGRGKRVVISLLGGMLVGAGCGVLVLIVSGVLLLLFLVGVAGAESGIVLVQAVGSVFVLPLVIIVAVVAGLITAVLFYVILSRRASSQS